MQSFKNRWEVKSNWQLIFPILGLLCLVFTSYIISKNILKNFIVPSDTDFSYIGILSSFTILITLLFLYTILQLFKVLRTRWNVTYRWELIAIFIVFAVTGSTSAKISDPIMSVLGFNSEVTSAWVYWLIRICVLFPTYQILLVLVGWLFGQFTFFWNFEKKMLKRIGLARFIKD